MGLQPRVDGTTDLDGQGRSGPRFDAAQSRDLGGFEHQLKTGFRHRVSVYTTVCMFAHRYRSAHAYMRTRFVNALSPMYDFRNSRNEIG